MIRALLVAVVLAGCGGNGGSASTPSVSTPTTAPTATQATAPTATQATETEAATTPPSAEPSPGAAFCESIEVVTDVISPTWTGLAEDTLTFEQAAATMGAAGAQLRELAEKEQNSEARRDIERLAQNAEDDQVALAREDVMGGGNAGLMGEIIIKWTERGVFCD